MPGYHTFREWPKTTLGVTIKKTFKKPKKPKNPGSLVNLLDPSYDLTTWSVAIGTPVVTFDQMGLNGVDDTATYVYDNGTTVEGIKKTVTVDNDNKRLVWRIFVREDGLTRAPEFICEITGGTRVGTALQLDTNTGALVNTLAYIPAGTITSETNLIEFEGTNWWEVIISVTNNSTGNISATLTLNPAKIDPATGGSNGNLVGSIRVGNAELFHDVTVGRVRGKAPVYTPTDPATTPFYDPGMMLFSGANAYYRLSPYTNAGNTTSAVCRFNVAAFTGDTLRVIYRDFGNSALGRTRSRIYVYSSDYTADTALRNKAVMRTHDTAGVVLCELLTDVEVCDGLDHFIFLAVDTSGSPRSLFYVDGLEGDDTTWANRVAVSTGTMVGGSAGLLDVSWPGAVTDFSVGYIGITNTYLTRPEDFMTDTGQLKEVDEVRWTEFAGSQPIFFNQFAKMDDNKGSQANLTANGTITGPA